MDEHKKEIDDFILSAERDGWHPKQIAAMREFMVKRLKNEAEGRLKKIYIEGHDDKHHKHLFRVYGRHRKESGKIVSESNEPSLQLPLSSARYNLQSITNYALYIGTPMSEDAMGQLYPEHRQVVEGTVTASKEFLDALDSGDLDRICISAFTLGVVKGVRDHINEIRHGILAAQSNKAINDPKKTVILKAKEIAKLKWKNDQSQKIKIGEMCEIIWASLIDEGCQDLLPDNPSGLKPWLRPVAPDYAKKGGRPTKK